MAKKPQPIILECMTFRMRGHEEASGGKYIPKGLMEEWAKLDPIENYEAFLVKENIISASDIDAIKKEIKAAINSAWTTADVEPRIKSTPEQELVDIYKSFNPEIILPSANKTEKRLIDAISDGLKQSMQKHDNLIITPHIGGNTEESFNKTEIFVANKLRDYVNKNR